MLLNSTCSLRKLRNLCSRLNKRLSHSHGQITEKNLHISQLEEAVKHLGAKVESTTDEAERKSKDVAELHLKLNENYRLVAELSSDNLRFVFLNLLVCNQNIFFQYRWQPMKNSYLVSSTLALLTKILSSNIQAPPRNQF